MKHGVIHSHKNDKKMSGKNMKTRIPFFCRTSFCHFLLNAAKRELLWMQTAAKKESSSTTFLSKLRQRIPDISNMKFTQDLERRALLGQISVRLNSCRAMLGAPSRHALIAILSLTLAAPLFAQADKPLLHERALPAVAAPGFAEPLAAPFAAVKGKWIPENGVLNILDIPAEKHIPVLHHKVGLASAVIDVEFRFDGAGSFLVGCDSDKHVGRVVINAKGLSIAEDSVKPSHTIATLPLAVKPGEWHRLRVEWKGDQMAARLDGKELRAQHAFLATAKARSWLAATQTVKVRNLKISGEPTTP